MHAERFLPAVAVTGGPKHHFFGYYDKCPWDATGRYLLALETDFMDRPPAPEDAATIGLVDLVEGGTFHPVARTRAWNWQQGTMLQWMPTAPDRQIIYNDRLDGRFVSIIRDVHSGTSRTLPLPIYAISRDGARAVSLNFSRLHRTRPGYGYAGVPDPWAQAPAPEQDGIYAMDLADGRHRLIISLAEMAAIRPKPSMDGAEHWFNHMQFSTDDRRFLFLHRWKKPGAASRTTRMLTARPDGSDVYLLADDGMVSHFDWAGPDQILAWSRVLPGGDRYHLYTDKSDRVTAVAQGVFSGDGHCSYSPDRQWMLTDTYPEQEHHQRLILYHFAGGRRTDIGRFYAPPEMAEELRCDLHPRWSRTGRAVCFDSAHEGHRRMYVTDVSEVIDRPG